MLRVEGTDYELALLQALCPKKGAPSLYRSALAVTPMLVGVFRPAVYLPDRAYTDEQLGNILRHELMHATCASGSSVLYSAPYCLCANVSRCSAVVLIWASQAAGHILYAQCFLP